ncbi:hypothetical protein EDD16DRAFT_1663650 [Pisolithus croceorrhizus]|nr:hypothetical protein EDD16DRAFT_1663650 [Pisolithus croceorrhizus]KAI6105019.1 hypothetical protein EV401DRAFT_2014212 [Pisolithus croceorrhizus]
MICVLQYSCHVISPYVPCGRSTPPLPLAIQCTSREEAELVMETLHCVLDPLLPEPSTSALVNTLSTSPATQNLLRNAGQDGFYAVVVGKPAGVHRTKQGAVEAGSSFSWPKWKRTDTLCEALIYLTVKGIEALLPPAVTRVHVATGSPTNTEDADIDEVDRLLQGTLHIELPEPSARDRTARPSAATNTLPTPRMTRRSVPSQPSAQPPSHHGPSVAQQTNPAQSSPQLPSHASPIIYIHVRSLRGITESHNHYSVNTATHTHALALGPHAARYLTAHGYTHKAVDIIIHACNSSSSDHQFSLRLSQHGLAMAEASYIWHLIHL